MVKGRVLGSVVVVVLGLGLVACGGDDGDEAQDVERDSSSDSSSDSSGSGGLPFGEASIDEYCDAVDDFIELYEGDSGDIAEEVEALEDLRLEVTEQAGSDDEREQVEACTQEVEDALVSSYFPDDESDDFSDDLSSDLSDEVGGGSADVEAYCDAVQDYVDLVAAAVDDPASAGPELAQAAQDLATQASGLASAGLTAEDAQRVAECGQEAADAVRDLTPGG
jgi:hypothetical protein